MIQSVMTVKSEDLEKAREIKAFLEKNYQVHYSYDELVRRFGFNELKLKRTFKAVANCNAYEFVTKVRIENAKVMLENTNRTIRDIAQQVGWDKSNFIKQFKQCTGQTPTAWRNNCGSTTFLFGTYRHMKMAESE
jgi:AraC-like DNA-binding protein